MRNYFRLLVDLLIIGSLGACSTDTSPAAGDAQADRAVIKPEVGVADAARPDLAPADLRTPDLSRADAARADAGASDRNSSGVSEWVTCLFLGSKTTQTCMGDSGHSCSGVSSCKVRVSNAVAIPITWKSTCSGNQRTSLDGKDETIAFKCGAGWIDLGVRPDGSARDMPSGTVKELVTCVFGGSTATQSCYSASFKCSGVGSCGVSVFGSSGTKMTWKSSCGGYAYTLIDGKDELAPFKCGVVVPDVGPPRDSSGTIAKENVTCIFSGSTTKQTCSSSMGHQCSGVSSCTVSVSGRRFSKLSWKSSCGGSPTTIIDGMDEKISFKCLPVRPDAGPVKDMPGGMVSEQVTCNFHGSGSMQQCYSSLTHTCSGVGSCPVTVTGLAGTKVTWKSSCGGYAYTTIDGMDEPADFKCP